MFICLILQVKNHREYICLNHTVFCAPEPYYLTTRRTLSPPFQVYFLLSINSHTTNKWTLSLKLP